MARLNTVVAGDYERHMIMKVGRELRLSTSLSEYIPLDSTTIESYRKIENAQSLAPAISGGIYVDIILKTGKQSTVLLNRKNYDMLLRNTHPKAPDRKPSLIQLAWKAFVIIFLVGLFASLFLPGA